MNGKDWILRMKGKHSITIFVNGEVRYSIGKMKLFVLKKNALREIESLLRLSLSDTDDSVNGNIIRFKDNNHVYCIKIVGFIQRFGKLSMNPVISRTNRKKLLNLQTL